MVQLRFLLVVSTALSSMSICSARAIDRHEQALVPRQNRNAANQRNGNANNQNNTNNNNNQAAAQLTLNAANVQPASQSDGQGNVVEAGQSRSKTDASNFINHCQGKRLMNGKQVTTGSCNGVVMGDIPASTNMISSIIISPAPGANMAANKAFEIQVKVDNLVAGSFTNPDVTYYTAPQTLEGGKVVGHTHVTVQSLGNSLTPQNAPDASTFAFFKGVNDVGNGQGLLSAKVDAGLPAGNYRVCTMTSSSNHQPVLMPVARRGAQDDCTKFTVGGNGANNNNNTNQNNNPNTGNNNNQQGGKNQGSKATTSSKTVKATLTPSRAAAVKASSKTKATVKAVAASLKTVKAAAQASATSRAVAGKATSKTKTTSTKATVKPASATPTSSKAAAQVPSTFSTTRGKTSSTKAVVVKPAANSATLPPLPLATGGVIFGGAMGKNTTVAAGRGKFRHHYAYV